MKYTTVLRDSFKIWRKHNSIWLFGIWGVLAGRLSFGVFTLYMEFTRASAGQALPQGVGATSAGRLVVSSVQALPPGAGATNAGRLVLSPGSVIILMAAGIVVWFLATLLAAFPLAAQIGMVRQAETENDATIRHGWQVAKARFRPLFLINALLGLPGLLVMLSLVALVEISTAISRNHLFTERPVTAASRQLALWLCYCPLCCTGILVLFIFIALGLTGVLAARLCVLEGLGAWASLRRGWQLLRRNLGYALLNALVVGSVFFIYSYLILFPARALWAPIRQAFFAANWSGAALFSGATLLRLGAYLLFAMLFSIIIGGILASFNETVWTRLYGEFMRGEIKPAALQGELDYAI